MAMDIVESTCDVLELNQYVKLRHGESELHESHDLQGAVDHSLYFGHNLQITKRGTMFS